MMNLLFGSNAELEILLDGVEERQKAATKLDSGVKELLPVFYDGEAVSGKVIVKLKHSKMEHYGIRIELFGVIEQFSDRSSRHEFLSMSRELARPGSVTHDCDYAFEYANVEKPYESYTGINVKLRYFLRVTVVKRLNDLVKEQEFAVHSLAQYPDSISSIKMEVGIENCLHIEFEYNKSKYHLKDVIVGKIYFLLVRVKVKHMEVQILRREQVGAGPSSLSDCEIVTKFEIMDGAPVRGETIPIRIFLSGYDLGPSMRDISKRFSVRYFLNLVLVDEEERRYFKQQEVTLFRRPLSNRTASRHPVAEDVRVERGFLHHHMLPSLRTSSNAVAATTVDDGERQVTDDDVEVEGEAAATEGVDADVVHGDSHDSDAGSSSGQT